MDIPAINITCPTEEQPLCECAEDNVNYEGFSSCACDEDYVIFCNNSNCTADVDKCNCNPGPHNVPDPVAGSSIITAPDRFNVTWQTTVSDVPVVLEVVREWSPLGADRFYSLIQDNYYDCAAFFRVVPGFVVQWGIASEPNETKKWNVAIQDDPVIQSNLYSYVSYADAGNDTRTAQIFVNLADNSRLNADGFSPFGRVLVGMENFENMYNPTPNNTNGANQALYTYLGNDWILEKYPQIDLIQGTGATSPPPTVTSAAITTAAASPLWWMVALVLSRIFWIK